MRCGRALTVQCGSEQLAVYLHVSAYVSPFSDPPRLMITLETCDPEQRLGPVFTVLSTNLPNMPAPPRRQFYAKTWSENEGLVEQLVAQGAVSHG